MTLRLQNDIVSFDPYFGGQMNVECDYLERLMMDDWALSPSVFAYNITWRPPQYLVGQLATNWEFSDPNTFVFHIRPGVHWQNLPPVNGREFVANDVVFHYDRLYGLGLGFKGSPFANKATYADLISITSSDKYTVAFKWKGNNPEVILETLLAVNTDLQFVAPEVVTQWGDGNDWHHAIGTGPFIVNDFVSGASATLVRNPTYWAYDERYPKNQLPYQDVIKYLIIPDPATAMAAMRTGKIDAMDGLTRTQSQQMQKTNPDISLIVTPSGNSSSMDPRNDVKPFNDIRVRQAMQMALDLPSIAKNFYGGMSQPYPVGLTTASESGWAWPYQQWPQDLKDQYAYNPTAAKKLLADAGYPNGFNTNLVVDSGGDLDFVQVVQSYFAAVGINMEIRPMLSSAWVAFVQQGHKHDQIGMRAGGSLALSYEPSRQLQRFYTGYSTNYAMVADPKFDAFYNGYVAATSVDTMKSILQQANDYVARQHLVIAFVESSSYQLVQPWFKGYNGQTGAISGTGTGPSTGFYLARFWIDPKAKK